MGHSRPLLGERGPVSTPFNSPPQLACLSLFPAAGQAATPSARHRSRQILSLAHRRPHEPVPRTQQRHSPLGVSRAELHKNAASRATRRRLTSRAKQKRTLKTTPSWPPARLARSAATRCTMHRGMAEKALLARPVARKSRRTRHHKPDSSTAGGVQAQGKKKPFPLGASGPSFTF